ncbi:MAG: hypothetical protein ACREPF_02545, partial [Rhodanobacteraceae bacterium]
VDDGQQFGGHALGRLLHANAHVRAKNGAAGITGTNTREIMAKGTRAQGAPQLSRHQQSPGTAP